MVSSTPPLSSTSPSFSPTPVAPTGPANGNPSNKDHCRFQANGETVEIRNVWDNNLEEEMEVRGGGQRLERSDSKSVPPPSYTTIAPHFTFLPFRFLASPL